MYIDNNSKPKVGGQEHINKKFFKENYLNEVLTGKMTAADLQRKLCISKKTYYNYKDECDKELKLGKYAGHPYDIQPLEMRLYEYINDDDNLHRGPKIEIHSLKHTYSLLTSEEFGVKLAKVQEALGSNTFQGKYDWLCSYGEKALTGNRIKGEISVLNELMNGFLYRIDYYYNQLEPPKPDPRVQEQTDTIERLREQVKTLEAQMRTYDLELAEYRKQLELKTEKEKKLEKLYGTTLYNSLNSSLSGWKEYRNDAERYFVYEKNLTYEDRMRCSDIVSSYDAICKFKTDLEKKTLDPLTVIEDKSFNAALKVLCRAEETLGKVEQAHLQIIAKQEATNRRIQEFFNNNSSNLGS